MVSPCRGRQSRLFVRDKLNQAPSVRRTLRHDLAVFREMSAERVDGLSALPDQEFPDPEDAGSPGV